jgi:hypothetical protein
MRITCPDRWAALDQTFAVRLDGILWDLWDA